ncbi:MAG: metalloprotease, partial [Chlamydiia bacterium]|nr:metalloprotease [Chlamydiia bacterium]
GGAYGGGASYQSLNGTFSFYSYRDPNLKSTVSAFRSAAKTLANGDFTRQHIREAKLEIIQKLDCPISPGLRGLTTFAWEREGLDLNTRQSYRHRLLNCSEDEIAKAMKDIILPQIEEGALVSFAGQELLEREGSKLKGFEIGKI